MQVFKRGYQIIITRELIFGISKNKLQTYPKILNMAIRLPEIVNAGMKKRLSDNYNESINFRNQQKQITNVPKNTEHDKEIA